MEKGTAGDVENASFPFLAMWPGVVSEEQKWRREGWSSTFWKCDRPHNLFSRQNHSETLEYSQRMHSINQRLDEGFDLRGAIGVGTVLLDEFYDGTADDDAIRFAGDGGSLLRI